MPTTVRKAKKADRTQRSPSQAGAIDKNDFTKRSRRLDVNISDFLGIEQRACCVCRLSYSDTNHIKPSDVFPTWVFSLRYPKVPR